jgi:hypothetical protein
MSLSFYQWKLVYLLSIEVSSTHTYIRATGRKSAILTAIVIGLGGRATSTGRGSGIKSLIWEGWQR